MTLHNFSYVDLLHHLQVRRTTIGFCMKYETFFPGNFHQLPLIFYISFI